MRDVSAVLGRPIWRSREGTRLLETRNDYRLGGLTLVGPIENGEPHLEE